MALNLQGLNELFQSFCQNHHQHYDLRQYYLLIYQSYLFSFVPFIVYGFLNFSQFVLFLRLLCFWGDQSYCSIEEEVVRLVKLIRLVATVVEKEPFGSQECLKYNYY